MPSNPDQAPWEGPYNFPNPSPDTPMNTETKTRVKPRDIDDVPVPAYFTKKKPPSRRPPPAPEPEVVDAPVPPPEALQPEAIIFNDDQTAALGRIDLWMASKDPNNRLMILKGPAGTGKSTLLQEVIRRYSWAIPTALSNKAARVLSRAIKVKKARTIYSALGLVLTSEEDGLVLKKSEYNVPIMYGSFVIVDEAYMMNREVLKELWAQAKQQNLKVLLVGDPYQLPPVNESSAIMDLDCPEAVLKKVVRFDNTLLTLTADIRKRIRKENYTIDGLFEETKDILILNDKDFQSTMLEAFQSAHSRHMENIDKVRTVAWTNAQVTDYNLRIREHLGIDTTQPYSVGDLLMVASPISVSRSASFGDKREIVSTIDDELRVVLVEQDVQRNVDFFHERKDIPVYRVSVVGDYKGVLTIPIDPQSIEDDLSALADQARLAGRSKERHKAKSMWTSFWSVKGTFHQVRHGWAITSHRAQGSTYDYAFVDVPNILKNRAREEAFRSLYVACSRPRKKLVVKLPSN